MFLLKLNTPFEISMTTFPFYYIFHIYALKNAGLQIHTNFERQ